MDRAGDRVSGAESQPGVPAPGAERLSSPLRQLTDTQRMSVAMASGLFEQLIDEVRQRETPRLNIDDLLTPLGADGHPGAVLAQMRNSVARAIDLYADLLGETFALYADAIEQVLRRDGGARPAVSAGGGSPVAINGAPGEEATATVWLHNVTGSPLSAAELRLTGLSAHDGRTLPVACAFSPPALDVAAGSSASAGLSVTLPPDAAAGVYHGLVLASGAPAASVPVLLTVR